MNEHPGWRQGYWEAEGSGEKKLLEYKRVSLRCWFETGKENDIFEKTEQRQKLGTGMKEGLNGHARRKMTYLVLRPVLGAGRVANASITSTMGEVSQTYS